MLHTCRSSSWINSVALLVCLSPVVLRAAPELQFDFGIVRGQDSQAQDTGRLYYTYYGIPYGEAPVGPRRFEPPVRFRGSGANRVVTSDTFPPSCTQPPNREFGPSSEDCLFLTVYAPPADVTAKKVMVYIPGGGFTGGGHRTYVPSGMVTEYDVIVVVIQYRLGALGWISSGDDMLPGNLGLRDQLLAISWVKENIARFGGDDQDITVFGQSAGGISLSILALSPLSKGLFQKVILQSGFATTKFALAENPSSDLYRFAEQFGCKPRFYFPGLLRLYHKNIRDCLMNVEATRLVTGSWAASGNIFSTGLLTGGGLAPVIDGDVLPREPYSLLADDRYLREQGVLDRSYILGVTNNDAGLMADIITFIPGRPYLLLTTPSNVAARVTAAAQRQFPGIPSQEMLNVIDFVYTYPRNPDGSIPLQNVMDLTLDGAFLMPSLIFARALAEKTSVYYYLFDHYPQLKNPNSLFKGTNHAMDNRYLFDRSEDPNVNLSFYANVFTAESEPVPAVYRGVLTSFAKTGAPTFSSAAGTLASWPRFESQHKQYLAISANPEVRKEVYAQRVSLWLDFLPKLSKTSGYFSSRSSRVAYD